MDLVAEPLLVVPEVPLVVLVLLVALLTVVSSLEEPQQSHAEMEQLQPALLELSSASMDLHSTADLELALLVLLVLLALLADLSLDSVDLDTAPPPSSMEDLAVHTDLDTQPAPLEDTEDGEHPIK